MLYTRAKRLEIFVDINIEISEVDPYKWIFTFFGKKRREEGRLFGIQEYGLSTFTLSEVISIFNMTIVTGKFCRLQR